MLIGAKVRPGVGVPVGVTVAVGVLVDVAVGVLVGVVGVLVGVGVELRSATLGTTTNSNTSRMMVRKKITNNHPNLSTFIIFFPSPLTPKNSQPFLP